MASACSSGAGGSSGGSGGSSGGNNPAGPFQGAWTVQSGMSVVTCGRGTSAFPDGGGYSNSNRTITSSFTPGEFALVFDQTSATTLGQDEEFCTDGGGCSPLSSCHWDWTATGNSAAMAGDAGCVENDVIDSAGDTEYVVITAADTVTLSGGALNETLGGTETITYGAQEVTCTISGSAVLTQ